MGSRGPSEEVKGDVQAGADGSLDHSGGQGNGQQWVDPGGAPEVDIAHLVDGWMWGGGFLRPHPGSWLRGRIDGAAIS